MYGGNRTRVTLQVWAFVKYVPRQSIAEHFEHELHYRFGHVQGMYGGNRTRVTLQVWAFVKYVPRQSIAEHFEHELHYRFGHV